MKRFFLMESLNWSNNDRAVVWFYHIRLNIDLADWSISSVWMYSVRYYYTSVKLDGNQNTKCIWYIIKVKDKLLLRNLSIKVYQSCSWEDMKVIWAQDTFWTCTINQGYCNDQGSPIVRILLIVAFTFANNLSQQGNKHCYSSLCIRKQRYILGY